MSQRLQWLLYLVYDCRSQLLVLVKHHTLQAYLEEFYPYPFPFPPFLFLAAVKLYLLHARDKLNDVTLVGGALPEPFVIELAAPFEKEYYPSYIECMVYQFFWRQN